MSIIVTVYITFILYSVNYFFLNAYLNTAVFLQTYIEHLESLLLWHSFIVK